MLFHFFFYISEIMTHLEIFKSTDILISVNNYGANMEKSKTKKHSRPKAARKPKSKAVRTSPKKTTRVTVDFPKAEHKRLKALAALEGSTLQEYIRSHVMDKVKHADIPDRKFKALLEETLEENDELLRRLADK
jgi:predicted DNA binding CopG/RHH family protein